MARVIIHFLVAHLRLPRKGILYNYSRRSGIDGRADWWFKRDMKDWEVQRTVREFSNRLREAELRAMYWKWLAVTGILLLGLAVLSLKGCVRV